MGIFGRLDRIASRAVDRINAIRFRLLPIASTPNGRGGTDADRAVVNGNGVFDYVSTEQGVQLGVRRSYREANDLRALQTGRDPQISIDRSYFAGQEPKQGDIIEFPNNPELPRFDVMTAKRDGLSRIVLELSHRGGQS